ncbi:MAG: GNAT family N-acetyltransferase [Flavobacteriales bacterium]
MQAEPEQPVLVRTSSSDPSFRELIAELDRDLAVRNGDSNAFFAAFNSVERIEQVVVVHLGQRPVGCGAFKPFGAQAVEVKRMYTVPEHRRKGLGALVLNDLEAWAAELGHTRCVLETGRAMTEAIALYTRQGYILIPNYGPYVGVAESVCFEKVVQRAVG